MSRKRFLTIELGSKHTTGRPSAAKLLTTKPFSHQTQKIVDVRIISKFFKDFKHLVPMGGGCVAGGMQIPKCGTTGKCKTGSIDSTGPKLGPTRIIRYHNLDLTILNISSKCLNNPHQKRGGFGRPGPSIGPTRKLLGPIQIICRCAAAFCLLPLGVLDLFTPYHSSFPPGPLGLASHGVRVAIRSQGPKPGPPGRAR